MLVQFALIVAGFALLIVGANALVDGASNIAARFGMPDRVVGLTICAVGTAMPELVVSVTSAVDGYADMAFGNVVGSCMANLLLILGLSAVVTPLGLSRRTQRFEIPVSVASVVLLMVMANLGGTLDALEGAILFVLFVAFIVHTVFEGLREGESGQEDLDPFVPQPDAVDDPDEGLPGERPHRLFVDLLLIAASIGFLKFGADFVVDNSVLVAEGLGLSERIIGITVVALGTCLPELVTSVVAAARGNTDIAVGNVVGSNITNVLLVMGVPALFSPVPYDPAYNFDFALLAVFSVALVGCAFIGRRHTFTRANGIVFVFLYVVYIVASMLR